MIEALGEPVDQENVPPGTDGVAVKVTLDPGQIIPSSLVFPEDSDTLIETVGGLFSTTLIDAGELKQPSRS